MALHNAPLFLPARCHCCHPWSLSCHSPRSSLRCLPAVTDCTLRIVLCLLAVQLYTLYTMLHICTQHGENTDLRCTGSRPKSWSSPIIIITIIIISAPTELRIPGPCHFVWTKAVSRDPLHYYRLYLGDSQHQARTIREDFHYSSTIVIRLLRSRTLITLTF